MGMLNILIDTNVILDVYLQREPFAASSQEIFRSCFIKEYNGFLAVHSFTDIFYILRKDYTQEDLRKLMLSLTEFFEISSLDKQKIMNALHRSNFSDFEDCLQDECAAEFEMDYIITRNTRDFINSKVPAITPEEFIKLKAV